MRPRKPNRGPTRGSPVNPGRPRQPQQIQEIVDPIWLLKALGITVVAAIVCAWLVVCLLYYQGSWQLVLRPVHTVDRTPAALNIPFQEIHFDSEETGQPRLTAWWIPAAAPISGPGALQTPPKYAADTVLYLHDGSGSLAASVPVLGLLHSFGINIFAVDYRGFGHSDASPHPTSETMAEDTSSALQYLIAARHVPADHIVPYGVGLGASLAVSLAKKHGELPAVVVDNPDPDATLTAIAAHPSGMVPIRWLYHEHFEIAAPLAGLPTPKLLISGGPNGTPSGSLNRRIQELFRSASSPAVSVVLPSTNYEAMYSEALSRFLDQYLPPNPQAR